MSRRHKDPRFNEVWANQTELGSHFGLSAVALGKKLSALGLRNEKREPSELAHAEAYCRLAPMRDGTPFYLWNVEKVGALLRQSGLRQLTEAERDERNRALQLISLYKEAEESGLDKLLFLFTDSIRQRDYPLVNRFLDELGSSLRLGAEDSAPGAEPSALPHRVSRKKQEDGPQEEQKPDQP